MRKITYVSNCSRWGFLFAKWNLELWKEQIKNKGFKKSYTICKRILKVYNTLHGVVYITASQPSYFWSDTILSLIQQAVTLYTHLRSEAGIQPFKWVCQTQHFGLRICQYDYSWKTFWVLFLPFSLRRRISFQNETV